MLVELIAYLLVGSFAGILAGMFGVGGGIIIVPVLVFVFSFLGFEDSYLVHIAIGTSLATIFFTGISSTRSHYLKGSIDSKAFFPIAIGISFGAILGAFIASSLNGDMLRKIIGIFAFLIAIQMMFNQNRNIKKSTNQIVSMLTGVGIGSASSVLGIGGGSFTVPFFKYNGIDMKTAIGTAAACGIPIAFFGSLSFITIGLNEEGLPPLALGFIYMPAMFLISLVSVFTASIGAGMAHAISDKILTILFSTLMILISTFMFFGASS
ncbi:MAG: sulfite exporter TauE/SafE family protein [SAR86 cluster bacterium]|nr:sulfite exporter TauE/SafE family protein [SAR86 cluster bacterium]